MTATAPPAGRYQARPSPMLPGRWTVLDTATGMIARHGRASRPLINLNGDQAAQLAARLNREHGRAERRRARIERREAAEQRRAARAEKSANRRTLPLSSPTAERRTS